MDRRGARHDRYQGHSGATALAITEAALELMERNLSAELCTAAGCSLG